MAVKGMRDIIKEEAAGFTYIEQLFSAVSSLYGYKEYRIPVLEYTDVFLRSTGEGSDVVRKEMYTFLDKGDRSVTMRPEFTAGIARAIVEKKLYATEDLPIKAFYFGPLFRYERPQLGRYREFSQAGVECIGADSAQIDAETICLAMQTLAMLGFEKLSLKVNCIGGKETREKYRLALKEYFGKYIDSMCQDCHERININPMRILDCKVEEDQKIAKDAPKLKDFISPEEEKRFYLTLSLLNDIGIEYEIDDFLVRGLDYYSGIVFEVHGVSNEGKEYGALLGGGHYDSLLASLGGPEMPGVGFAFGIDRLYSLMKDNNLLNNENIEQTPDVYMIPVCEEAKENSLLLATRIRNLGYICEVHYDANKIGSSIKKAVKKGAKYAMIIGDNEVKEGIVQLKNLANEEQISVALDDLEDKLDELFQEKEDDCCCGGHHHEDGECCHQGHHHEDGECCRGHHHEEGGCCHHEDDEQE